ncbi:hypothetical protein C8J57DRAFT_1466926 [Mycena rebaudengoi]|nr:hypothetical protein C8J57DRAFT_1466926 [Mycena rebaudengoi]
MSETPTLVYLSGTGQLMAMAAAYGIYALLFSLSVVLLIRKGIRNCMPRQILLVSTCLMFTASTALAAVDTAIYIVQISVTDYIRTSNGLQLSCEILFDSLFLMGDAVVLWRTWTLCEDRRVLVIFPMTLWLGGIACLLTLIGYAAHNGSSSDWTIGVYDTDLTNHLSMSTAALSAATNFFSTLLISWKAWQHRSMLKRNTDRRGTATRVQKILSLLVESGFFYFTLWVIAMLNFYLVWDAPVLQAMLRGLYDMIIGMYPTVVIIIVSLDYTFWDSSRSDSSLAPMLGSTGRKFSTTQNSSLGSVNISGIKHDQSQDKARWS